MIRAAAWGVLLLAPSLFAQAKAVRSVDSEKGIQVSCRVEDLNGKVVFDWDGSTSRVLASNIKLLTTAGALMALPADFRWQTRALLSGSNLHLIGGGDPSIRSLPDRDVKVEFLDGLAAAIKSSGVSTLETVVLDDRYFDRVFRHPLWPKDQWQAEYSAPVGGLMMEGGCLELHGQSGKIQIVPAMGQQVQLRRNKAQDASRFSAYWRKADFELQVTGGPKKKRVLRFAVGNPVIAFGHWVQQGLQERGISCNKVELVDVDDPPLAGKEIWTHQSAWTLADAVVVANKESDNFVAECILKTIGAEGFGDGSATGGAKAIREIFAQEDLSVSSIHQTDGSGFARSKDNSANKASPEMLCSLLREMAGRPEGKLLFDSLPIAEHSRRTSKFFKDKIFKPQRVHAKTGWITGASSLSGYLQTLDNRTLVFSIVVNYVKDNTPRTNNHRFRQLQAQILSDILSTTHASSD